MASFKFGSRIVAPGLSALALACLGPNPLLDAGEEDSSTTGDGDGDGDTGDGDGDGETGDGDGDGDSASCTNAAQDPGETDIDCGGDCGPCSDGQACVEQTDCLSQVCAASMCAAPSCDDEIQNGDEAGIDCGGAACGFCEYGSLIAELDDFEGSAASNPRPAMFADGSFALTYNGPMEARARWYDEFGVATSASVELHPDIDFVGNRVVPTFAGDDDEHSIHVLEAGTDAMSGSTDLFLVRLTQLGPDFKFRVNLANQLVNDGDLTVEGSVATISWMANDDVLTRRFDYDVANGSWTDITPFSADTMANDFDGEYVAVDRNAEGVGVVAWFRTAAGGGLPWTIAVRRFDSGWIDPAPVISAAFPDGYPATEPRVAIASDGRVAVIVRLIDLDQSSVGAWMLDQDLEPEGDPWILQKDIPNNPSLTSGDVEALSDGSFAFVWPDTGQNRVHLRRFVGASMPKLPDVGDESPWPVLGSPAVTRLAGIDGRLVVVWSAVVDSVRQIQGQVLSY